MNPDQEELDRWTNDNLEHLRYEYDLNENSIIVDIGAFKCEWSIKISEKYNNPSILAFEASKTFFDEAYNNIANFNNIKLVNKAISNQFKKENIKIGVADGVSTSFFIESENEEEVDCIPASEIFSTFGLNNVDLMKINIEGSEYDVLEYLIDNNLITKVKNIQVQFHRLGDNYMDRFLKIKENLRKTHKLTYECLFIWENWELCQ